MPVEGHERRSRRATSARRNSAGEVPAEQERLVVEDADVRAYLRAPYDPYYSARMAGRATGEVVRRPPERGWPRAMAALLALTLLSMPGLGIARILGGGPLDEGGQMVLVASPFGYAGLLLIWRLARQGRPQRP